MTEENFCLLFITGVAKLKPGYDVNESCHGTTWRTYV
uniref:Uncharacterized protein n=1 Tax=Schistosoma mansoni TaxID=6183 RepID=A0A913KVJ7_SCHMA